MYILLVYLEHVYKFWYANFTDDKRVMTNESFDLSRWVIAVYAGSSNSNVGLIRLSS